MQYLGEIISIGVAFSFTITAIASELATKRLGVAVANVWRMLFAVVASGALCWVLLGSPYPVYANWQAWGWLALSGVVGYFFGDWCLFNAYLHIGSRYAQLFMTLAPIFSALGGWFALGQRLSLMSILAMTVTILGIAIGVMSTGGEHKVQVNLPLKGILFGIGASIGQGFGLVLSKVGMDAYTAGVPWQVLPHMANSLPFAANMIRTIAGLLCFGGWLLLAGKGKRFVEGGRDGKGLLLLAVAVTFGPFLGVGFSLLAVQYTAAGIAATLIASTPIIILIPSWYLFKQRITAASIIGAIISVLGGAMFFL